MFHLCLQHLYTFLLKSGHIYSMVEDNIASSFVDAFLNMRYLGYLQGVFNISYTLGPINKISFSFSCSMSNFL